MKRWGRFTEKIIPVTMTVDSAFFMDEEWDTLDSAKVGSAFESWIESNVFTTKDGLYDTVEYTLAEGKLPAGIELGADGKLAGTPEAAGEYTVTVSVLATKTVETVDFIGQPKSETTQNSGTYTFTIIVSE